MTDRPFEPIGQMYGDVLGEELAGYELGEEGDGSGLGEGSGTEDGAWFCDDWFSAV
jgi:hypothetical protein